MKQESMFKEGDLVVRVKKPNEQIASPIGTYGVVTEVDRGDSSYLVSLLQGEMTGEVVWWFHEYTALANPKPNWEV